MNPILISPSLLAADPCKLGEEVQKIEKAGADLIHLDIMDGHYVPNITFGPHIIKSLRQKTRLPFDVHLMTNTPEHFINSFDDAGADMITFHPEATHHPYRLLECIKKRGLKAGYALNPGTNLSVILPVLDILDVILVMSVNPGFGGQIFIPTTLTRLHHLKQMLYDHGKNCTIAVDGGINTSIAHDVVKAGASLLVAGSAIFQSDDYARTISKLKE